MAVDTQKLPPPQFIVPKTGHRLAAGTSERWGLSVDVFDPGKDGQQVCQRRSANWAPR